MTRVLTVGYEEYEVLPDQPALHAFPQTLQRADLERLTELIADDLSQQQTVVAIYPSWWAEPALQRLQTIRAALDATGVLLHASSLPPLAGSVLCALASAVGPWAPAPGVFLAGLPLLERQLLPVARLGKVSGLQDPAPSVWQHLASWWPTSSFAVSWWPRPGVRRLRAKDPSVPLPPAEVWTGVPLDRIIVASPERVPIDWVRSHVARPLGIDAVQQVPPQPQGQRFWGTRAVLEAVAYPSDVPLLVSWLVEGHHVERCQWCGETVVSAECPFCRADRAAMAAAGRER